MIPILLIALSATMPIPKKGTCPPGYSTSGNYCNPTKDAGTAIRIDHMEACPSGMTRSGSYCKAPSSR